MNLTALLADAPSLPQTSNTAWFIVLMCVAVVAGLTLLLAAIFGMGKFYRRNSKSQEPR